MSKKCKEERAGGSNTLMPRPCSSTAYFYLLSLVHRFIIPNVFFYRPLVSSFSKNKRIRDEELAPLLRTITITILT